MNYVLGLMGRDVEKLTGGIGKRKKKEGLKPGLPVLIVPGLCSSALRLDAGYAPWLNQRLWLNISRMGLERLRIGHESRESFNDPDHPAVKPGIVYVREGMLFHDWKRYYVLLDSTRKGLMFFKEEDVKLDNPDAPLLDQTYTVPDDAEAEHLFVLDHRTKVSFSSHHVHDTDSTHSVCLASQDNKILIGQTTDGLVEWRYTELFLLLSNLYPHKKRTADSHLQPLIEKIKSQKRKDTPVNNNLWLEHMMLDPVDGMSDPPTVRLRVEEGIDAISYLDPGTFVRDASYVFGPVLENLKALGYDEDSITAMPYDWRMPPHGLEVRDTYFTRMMQEIESLSTKNDGKRVLLLAHSMGNCVVRYFLRYVLRHSEDGQAWLDKYIHTFFAVGAPWLGAPKSVRGLISGDKMGLDAFISKKQACLMARSWASTPWLFPEQPELFFKHCEAIDNFAVWVKEDGTLEAKDKLEALKESGVDSQVGFYDRYYVADPVVSAPEPVRPPTVKLMCVYGINLDTEVASLFEQKEKVKLSKTTELTVPGYILRKGILYETEHSQQAMRELAGEENVTASGDGTVPYASLAYPFKWKNEGMDVEVLEIEGAPHREVLEDKTFLSVLLEYLSHHAADEPTSFSVEGAVASAADDHGEDWGEISHDQYVENAATAEFTPVEQ